jgi:hypothetical protein
MPFYDVYMMECLEIIEYINDYYTNEKRKEHEDVKYL